MLPISIVCAVLSGAIGVLVALTRRDRGDRLLLLVGSLAAAGWCVWAGYYSRGQLDHRISALYLSAVSVAVESWMVVAVRLIRRDWWPRRWVAATLVAEPALMALSATLPHRAWEQLFWSDRPWKHETFGPVYDAHTVFCIAVIALGGAFLLRRAEQTIGLDRWLAVGSVLAVTIGVGGQLTGVRIMQFTVVAALALIIAVLLRCDPDDLSALAEIAERDPVTGVMGRGGLDRVLAHAILLARQGSGPLCALVIDIDHFKGINDTHGHIAGDVVLRTLATRVRGVVGGFVGRFGGDEFVAVLFGMELPAAEDLARRIVAEVSLPLEAGGGELTPAVSVGIAAYTGGSTDDLLVAADRAMYTAKRAGGNQVSVAAATAQPPLRR